MKNLQLSLCLALAGLFWAASTGPALAQNPFFTPAPQERRHSPDDLRETGREGRPATQTAPSPAPGFRPPFFNQIMAMQRMLRQKMTGYARHIQEKPLGAATWQMMALSLLYGMIHALGPGHGKSIVCSYFLSRRGTIRQALVFGNLITAIHILSSVVIVVGLSWFMGSANIVAFHGVEGRLESISYVLIMCIGAFLLGRTLYEWRQARRKEPDACSRATTRDMLSLALASGLMPCPGAALILLFTLSLGIFWAGLLAMIPLALGMGLTASFLGVLTVGSTGLALNVSRRSAKTYALLHRSLACLGALIIILLGASLFFGSRAI